MSRIMTAIIDVMDKRDIPLEEITGSDIIS